MKCGKKAGDDGEFCARNRHMFDRSRTLYQYAAAAPSIYRFKYKGNRNTPETPSEKKWENMEILSAAYRRTYVEVTKDAIAAGNICRHIINGYMITAMGQLVSVFRTAWLLFSSASHGGRAIKGKFGTFETFTGGGMHLLLSGKLRSVQIFGAVPSPVLCRMKYAAG